MDALELLKSRRSVMAPFLGSPGPNENQLREILTIGSRVPDHGKLTPWRFIVFEGAAREAAGKRLADLITKREPDSTSDRLEEERRRFSRAPLVIAVVSAATPHPKIPEFEQLLSAANAAMMLVLAAHALGFAAHWVTEWVAFDHAAGQILGLGPGERFVGFVHIGTPAMRPSDRPRPDLKDVVTYWGS
ncbi:MAG: nitroreductase [Hyphomicrobiales bacterium]|nr:nitroreductase [Hyphomicrobiales bacterium]